MDCIARQAPLSMGFFGQEYWSGLPCPPTGDLSDSGIKPASLTSPALAGMFFVVVQSLSQKIKICLCDPKDCNTPGFPVLHYLPELAQTHVHWVSDAIQPSHPLSSPPPPAFDLSSIRIFSKESALHIRWPKYWSFSSSTSNEYSGLISLRIYWSDLLAVQGTLKSLLQHHSLKASILWCSTFFLVQL